MRFLLEHFKEGGWGMWPILLLLGFTTWLVVERSKYLFFSSGTEQRAFLALMRRLLMQGNVAGAVTACKENGKPLAKIVEAGLRALDKDDEHVQNAVDAIALRELAKIEHRTGYLAMLGNVATLMGLLGTITGLIKSFAGVGIGQDAAAQAAAGAASQSSKAELLAAGISEAMNCTAFGLIVGILALLGYSILNGRTQNLLDEINEATVSVLNLATGHRQAMNLQGIRDIPPV
ncbi:MAG: MotA/TolQ/ExbB proton channel family protein [Myxococcota bacterium]